MKATDFFRALDDSDLDPYEIRYVLRVWRRGACWEKLEKTRDTAAKISLGKLSQVRRDLEAKGWLEKVIVNERVAYQVAIPTCCTVSQSESDSLYDVEFHQMKSEFHEVKPEFHQMKSEFHVVHALPLIDQKEDHPFKHTDAPAPALVDLDGDGEQEAKQRAWDATVSLIEFWEQLTKRKRPPSDSENFRENWFKPFNEIWIACGRSIDAAKAKVQAVRDEILSRGGRIFDPAKLPAHIQALIDAELLPMTARLNGNGYVNFKNDPNAREAHNRAVMAEVAAEIESGEWSPWQI